jgi:hypothetical protein
VASFATPAFGQLIQHCGESTYEILMMVGIFSIISVHSTFLFVPDAIEGQTGSDLLIFPVFVFGVGHALFTCL